LLIQGGTEWLTASSDHSQAVVLKVSKAVSSPLNELHFSMENREQESQASVIAASPPIRVALIAAANDAPLNSALGLKGPSAPAKSGRLHLPKDDNWLNKDQSATRK
jgi:hypothetical protein